MSSDECVLVLELGEMQISDALWNEHVVNSQGESFFWFIRDLLGEYQQKVRLYIRRSGPSIYDYELLCVQMVRDSAEPYLQEYAAHRFSYGRIDLKWSQAGHVILDALLVRIKDWEIIYPDFQSGTKDDDDRVQRTIEFVRELYRSVSQQWDAWITIIVMYVSYAREDLTLIVHPFERRASNIVSD